MASLTTAYLLFYQLAKENNWPINDENFLQAATVGFFAPYVFRFKAGDKVVGNNEAWGRRAAFFAGSSLVYPIIEDLKSHNYDKKSLSIEKGERQKRYIIVDPCVNLDAFYNRNSHLLQQNSSNIAYFIGILSALVIARKWDEFVQRDNNGGRIDFNGLIASIPSGFVTFTKSLRGINLDSYTKENGSIRISKPRSMLYKVYPRLDKQVIDRTGADQSFFDGATSILVNYYSKEEYDNSIKPYWRIPSQKELSPKKSTRVNPKYNKSDDEYMEDCIEIAFPEHIRDYFIDEVVNDFPKYEDFNNLLEMYRNMCDKEKNEQSSHKPMITPCDIGNICYPNSVTQPNKPNPLEEYTTD